MKNREDYHGQIEQTDPIGFFDLVHPGLSYCTMSPLTTSPGCRKTVLCLVLDCFITVLSYRGAFLGREVVIMFERANQEAKVQLGLLTG